MPFVPRTAAYRASLLATLSIVAATLLCLPARTQDAKSRKDPSWLLPVPEADADPKIPTLAQVVGHSWGRDISSHAEVERYCQALAKAAPERHCRLVKYGQTYQGKDLHYLVLSSAENLKNVEQHRKNNLALADSRTTSADRARQIASQGPAVVWLAYCIHGNEASPSDAALLTAYHLLADRRATTRELLDRLIVIVDPLQNPDGRDRFVNFHRETRGGFDQEDPLASDRLERWPGGRFNHYLFDMNRDWYLQSQKESARVAAFLHWKPQVFVDAHEMWADSTYFFDPPTEPYNPHTLRRQKDWHLKIGRNHAEHFDRYGFAYTTREMFDAFGPQYGSTWPTLHGSIGILWEQAGARGRVIARADQTKLHYHDGVRHHYVSGLATLEAAARDRQPLLLDFHANAVDSVKVGDSGPVRAFFLLEGKRPTRAANLARMLLRNGIEVRRMTTASKVKAADTISEKAKDHVVPVGSYFVPLNQPGSRLALTLLERHQEMGANYIKRQEERVKRGLPDEIYDSTSWSLPLACDVPCLAVSTSVSIASEPFDGKTSAGRIVGERPRIGYLLSGDDDNTLPALCHWLSQGLRVHVFSEPTRVQGVSFPRGSLLLRVAENPENLHEQVKSAVNKHGLTVHAIENAFVEEGASLGGPNVQWVKPPRVLLMVDRPALSSVGHTWYLFDQVWRYPVTRIAGRSLTQVDWSKFDVCILPSGTYTGTDAPTDDAVRRLKDWVQGGGTLIVVGGAAEWATGDKVKLLASKLERRPGPVAKEEPLPEKKGKKIDKQLPLRVPGVFLKAVVDDDHFVTWGNGKEALVHFNGSRLFAPLKETDGKNLVAFAKEDLLVSGYCWPQTVELLPEKAYVLYQGLGRGRVIGFADDPNYRAFSPSLQRLFFNAVFAGPPTGR